MELPIPRPHRREIGLVCALLAVTALLRLWGVFDRGVFLWDEGSYLMQGRFIATGVRAAIWKLAGAALPWVEEPTGDDLRAMVRGIEPGLQAKPGHTGLVAVFMLVFGDTEWAPVLVSVVASLLCVWLVWLIGRRYICPAGALVAAGVLAVSPYAVFYGRVGLAELDLAAAVLLMVWLLLRHAEGERPLSPRAGLSLGLVAGLAFLINIRALVPVGLAGLWLAAMLWRHRRPWGPSIGVLALFGVGVVLPLLATEGIYQGMRSVMHSVRPESELLTYFGQLKYMAEALGGTPKTLGNLPTYPYLLAVWEWPALLLAAIGAVYALHRRRMADAVVLSVLLLPLLQWSTRADAYARLAVMGLPLYALLAGLGFQMLWHARRPRVAAHAVAIGLLVILIPWTAWRNAPVLAAKSSHAHALAVTRQGGSEQIVDTNGGVAAVYEQFYTLDQIHRPPEEPEEALPALEAARDAGAKHVIMELQRFVKGATLMHLERYQASACSVIERSCTPVWEAPQMEGLLFHHSFEHNWGFAGTLGLCRAYADEPDRIRIYLIEDAIGALEAHLREGDSDTVAKLDETSTPAVYGGH